MALCHKVSTTSALAQRSERIGITKLTVVAGAISIAFASTVMRPTTVFAQAREVPGAVPAKAPSLAPSGRNSSVNTPIMPATSAPSTISPTLVEAPEKAPRPALRHPHRQRKTHYKTPDKTPTWVIRSRAQLALEADARFKNVHPSTTQPGVIVLEGEVFDDAAKAAAQQTVAGVQGVKRVINALTTETLKWLLLQNRVNQALQRNGFALVKVKIIGKTAYISGQVSSEEDEDRAISVVNSVAPDLTIGTDLIEIKSSIF